MSTTKALAKSTKQIHTVAQFRLRIKCNDDIAIGPGKIALLEAIAQTGSISAGARALGMSYRRAWFLVDQMNHYFLEPVARTSAGGTQGGGAKLTPSGLEVIRLYRTIEQQAHLASASLLEALSHKIKTPD